MQRQAPGTALASTHAYGWRGAAGTRDCKRRRGHLKGFLAARQAFKDRRILVLLEGLQWGDNECIAATKCGGGLDAKTHSMLFVNS
jgi:hypothetical protein